MKVDAKQQNWRDATATSEVKDRVDAAVNEIFRAAGLEFHTLSGTEHFIEPYGSTLALRENDFWLGAELTKRIGFNSILYESFARSEDPEKLRDRILAMANANCAKVMNDKAASIESRPEFATTSVKELELSSYIHHALYCENIETVQQLRDASDVEILKIPNLGKKALSEIRNAISRLAGGDA